MGDIPIVEPVVVPDVFCTELIRIERVGPAYRLVFAVQQNNTRVVISKIVLPASELPDIALQLAQVIHRDRP